MYKILVVEDDRNIAQIIEHSIEKWGYHTYGIKDFSDILNAFINYKPHLVLLDIILPCYDGYHWCRKIRELSSVPILFISSKDSNMDIVMAVNMGGDDFLQKPFSIEVLIAKINALLRRTYAYINEHSSMVEYKDVILNMDNHTLSHKDNVLELTKNEFRILSILMRNGGSIISREKIMRKLWEHESFVDDNTLTVNINRLRKKLETIQLIDFIITKKGQGYSLR